MIGMRDTLDDHPIPLNLLRKLAKLGPYQRQKRKTIEHDAEEKYFHCDFFCS